MGRHQHKYEPDETATLLYWCEHCSMIFCRPELKYFDDYPKKYKCTYCFSDSQVKVFGFSIFKGLRYISQQTDFSIKLNMFDK